MYLLSISKTKKVIMFWAAEDYNQTSEFIRRLKANIVVRSPCVSHASHEVLVHGEEHEMNRMRNKLREDMGNLQGTSKGPIIININ